MTQAAVAPPAGASVCFAIGTPGIDEVLVRARRWIAAVVGAAGGGDAVQLCTLTSCAALANHLAVIQPRVVSQTLGSGARTALGGLGAHTLVLVTRALPADAGSGVLCYGADGQGANDVVVASRHLGFLQRTGGDDDPHVVAAGIDGQPAAFQRQVRDAAVLLDFLVRSAYRAVYLCACGAGPALGPVAQAIRSLTDLTVYHNDQPLQLDDDGAGNVRARVGPAGGGAANGTRYYGSASVSLVSSATSFLPGAEARVP